LQDTSNKQIFEGTRNKGDDIHYSGEISLAQILKDLKFPANKDQVVRFVREMGGHQDLVAVLRKIENKSFSNVTEVTKASGLDRWHKKAISRCFCLK
jgi:Protein of unknown function (DUF2795)